MARHVQLLDFSLYWPGNVGYMLISTYTLLKKKFFLWLSNSSRNKYHSSRFTHAPCTFFQSYPYGFDVNFELVYGLLLVLSPSEVIFQRWQLMSLQKGKGGTSPQKYSLPTKSKPSNVISEMGVASHSKKSLPGEPSIVLDPSLDFLSETFDPVKALHCSLDEVHLPHPLIKACDNLQAYSSGDLITLHYDTHMTLHNDSILLLHVIDVPYHMIRVQELA